MINPPPKKNNNKKQTKGISCGHRQSTLAPHPSPNAQTETVDNQLQQAQVLKTAVRESASMGMLLKLETNLSSLVALTCQASN